MKYRWATGCAVFLSCLSHLQAQEPPLPAATETPSATPKVRPELNIPEIPLTVEPSPLVPNSSSPPVKKSAPPLSELDAAFQRSPLGLAAEEHRLHLEWRQLQNRASLDPGVVAAKAAVKTARTDLEKRERLRAYYKVYYARMQLLASAPDVKAYLEAKKNATLASLAQPRVRPESTEPPRSRP